MLIQLKETKHGAPWVDDEDVPEELRSTNAPDVKDENDGTDSLYFKRWDWVLDEMIWVFAEHLDDEADDKFHTGKHDIMFKPVEYGDKKTLVEMYEGPKSTYVFDKEGYTAWTKRKQNAFILFGKYYQSLWD
jgi:hypothetical protein